MKNKTILITGATAGIGKQTAIELAKQAKEIIILGRKGEKANNALTEIKQLSGSDAVSFFPVDLASLESVKKAAAEVSKAYARIDILINNAGVFTKQEKQSPEGFEITIAVNYIAVFALTNLLLPLLPAGGRIINVSSELYKGGKVYLDNKFSAPDFNGQKAYANSKMLVNYFTKNLAEKLKSRQITVNCLHPGVVATDVFREYPKWLNKVLGLFIAKPADGAKPSLYLASSDELTDVTGAYFYKTKRKEMLAALNDHDLNEKIQTLTEELTGIQFTETAENTVN